MKPIDEAPPGLTFEIGGVECTAVISNADDSGGLLVSIQSPDGVITPVTRPYEVFHSTAHGRGIECGAFVCGGTKTGQAVLKFVHQFLADGYRTVCLRYRMDMRAPVPQKRR